MKRIRKWSKKKKCLVALLVVAVVSVAVVIGVRVHMKKKMTMGTEMSVQSVTAEKGNVSTTVVGTGTLEGNAGTDICIPSGIVVEEVLVESGDEVKAGDSLATVNEASVASVLLEVKENIDAVEDAIDELSSDANDSSTTEYLKKKVLEGQLDSLEEMETFLTKMLKKKTIVAGKDGIITAVNVSTGSDKTSGNTSGTASNLQVRADVSTSVVSEKITNCTTKESSSGITFLSAVQEESKQDSDEESGENRISITKCKLDLTAPVTGAVPQKEIQETDEFTGTITWNCKNATFQGDEAYTATIQLKAKDGYVFADNIKVEITGATVKSEVRETDAGENILHIEAQFAKTIAEQKNTTVDKNEKNNQTVSGSENVAQQKQSSMVAAASSAGAGSSAVSEATSASEAYEIDETSAFTIVSNKEVAVSISVDELDILTVEEGQKATITLDALEGESFEGTITKVSHTASSGGSSVKYPVEITLEKTEDMLIGMSASATITVEESEDAVVIPVLALQEKGNTAFVYTEQDADGNLAGEVEVEVGLSNGTQVEIISGLEEGTTVYYLKSESTSEVSGNGMPNGGAMPDMGEMPGGGNAPGGGSAPDMGEMPSGGMPGGNQGGGQR